MGRISKTFVLFLTFIVVMSGLTLLTVKPANAQIEVTTPIIPAFNVTFQTYSEYIPPIYGVDPSSGKAVMTKAGYTQLDQWVNVNIGGQPFVRYNNSAGQLISLYYEVRWKGNHDTSWQTVPQSIHFEDAADSLASQAIGCLISIGFKGVNSGGGAEGYMALLDPTATQIDFQVEAMIGYYNSNDAFVGQSSGWSNTQTHQVQVVPNPTPTPILTLTPTPSVPEFSWLTILPILLTTTIALTIVRKKMVKKF
jgi:hypothetical protein